MDKPIEQFSDKELLAVMRKAENTNVPGSLYQRANNEWQIRQQQPSFWKWTLNHIVEIAVGVIIIAIAAWLGFK